MILLTQLIWMHKGASAYEKADDCMHPLCSSYVVGVRQVAGTSVDCAGGTYCRYVEAKWLRSSGEEALIDEFTQAVGMGNVDVCLDFMADGTLDASYNERVSHGTWTVSDADDTYTITVDGRSGDVVWADDTVTLEMDGTAIVFVQTEE